MFRNYLKIAWRNLLKSKAYSVINISGLAAGITCAVAIGLFIDDEYSFDRFHRNAAHIYRVVQQQVQSGETYDVASSPGPMAKALKTDFPEVVNACLLGYRRSGILQHGNTTVESTAITMADTGFLKIFDFPLIMGNAEKLFREPDQIVITDHMAARLFGENWRFDKRLPGAAIIYNKNKSLSLAGVIQEPPANSHLQFEVILTYDPNDQQNNWNSNNYLTYIQLKDGASAGEFNRKLDGYINKYRDPAKSSFAPPVFSLQPLTDIYLHSDFDFQTDWAKTGNILYVRVFITVAIVVLLIAVFNFINLSTARAIRRAKEVGIRKTIGAYYSQLTSQFFVESMLITACSFVLGIALVAAGLPLLNEFSGKMLSLPLTDPAFIGSIVLLLIVVSILAGIYPAIYLSSFQPVKVLKGVFNVHSGKNFRQILVVTQFTFTVILMAGTIIIYQQLNFLREKKLGFDKSNLLYLKTPNIPVHNLNLLKHELQQQGSIANAALASNSLIDVINSTSGITWEGQSSGDQFLITQLNADPDYFATTGMRMVAGRNFSAAIPTDTAAYVVNETAAKRMGWTPEEALGKNFSIWQMPGTIIGVVGDFHFRPMTAAIEPLVFMYQPLRWYSGILVKVNPGRVRNAISSIEKSWKKYESDVPPSYSFVDEQLDRQYRLEQQAAKIILFFAALAIIVACLGLYGLTIFSTERRIKEIGVRKVMGASVANISGLLSKDLLRPVLWSTLLASPVGYLLMRSWLDGFVYRISLGVRFFLLAALIPLAFALLTIGIEAVKAAHRDVVKSLRTE
jgi:putative ABC transport system permease protein